MPQTERVELTLSSLGDLDQGKTMLAFQAELKRIILDCLNRPNDKKVRKLSLILTLKPEADETGDCTGVIGNFDIKATLPPRSTRMYDFGVTKAGQAYFMSEAEERDVADPIDD
jgi:hypothetical protein